jgi:hypothetical protein
MPISPARGVNRAVKATRSPRASHASSSPSAPPARESSVLSVSSWRAIRPRAERRAQRELALAADQTRDREVRDVGADEQQHERRGGQQREQRRTRAFRQLVLHRQRTDLEAGCRRIRLGVRGCHALRDHRQIAPRALDADAWPQPADSRHHPHRSVFRHHRRRSERARRYRHVDVVVFRILRHGRQHADDGVLLVIHLKHAADDVRIAAERVLPVRVAEDQHRRRVLPIIVGAKRAAQERRDADHIEEVVRDDPRLHARCADAVEEVESHLVIFDERIERRRLLPVIGNLLRGQPHFVVAGQRLPLTHVDQPIAARVRQRAKQHGVDDAEDGGVRADAERQRQQDQDRVGRVLAETARRVAQVLPERVDRADPPRVAALVFHLREAAEPAKRGGTRGGWIRAAPDLLLDLELEMTAQLGIHLLLEPARAHRPAQTAEPCERGHACCSTRATAVATRSHVAVSSASCLRPLFVSW